MDSSPIVIKVEPDPEFAKLAATMSAAAKEIREMYLSVKQITDALEQTLKKLDTVEIKYNSEPKLALCALCDDSGLWNGRYWSHLNSSPRHMFIVKKTASLFNAGVLNVHEVRAKLGLEEDKTND